MTKYNGNQFSILQALTNDFKAFQNETLTVSSTAQKLTVPRGARYALIMIESDIDTTTGNAVRFWMDGSSPTSSSGFFGNHGDRLDLTDTENVNNFRVIEEVAGTTKLIIQYFK